MKRYSILALALVLGCTVFTGCRRRDGHMETVPPMTQAITEAPTIPLTEPYTRPTEPPFTAVPDETQTESGDTGTTDSTADSGPRVPQPNNR